VGNHFRSDLLSDASSNELRKPRGIRALEPSQGGLGRRDFVSVVNHMLGPATGAGVCIGDLEHVSSSSVIVMPA